jgi:hypothetical protein
MPVASSAMLEPPDPHRAGAAFLAWLAKQGGDEDSSVCEFQWALSKINHPTPELDGVGLYEYLASLGHELVVRKGKIVELTPKGSKWATKWAISYGVSRRSYMAAFDDTMGRAIL